MQVIIFKVVAHEKEPEKFGFAFAKKGIFEARGIRQGA